MKASTQILRPINFIHLANQTAGVLHSPPTPTQGGSSSSTLVMTTSLTRLLSDCQMFVVQEKKANFVSNQNQQHLLMLSLEQLREKLVSCELCF